MALSTSCLDRARLRDLLDGLLPDDEQAELTRHPDTCSSCQQKLEALAAGEGSWPGTTPWLGHEPAGLESALRQAMSVLKGDTADLLDTFPDNDDYPRALLTPSEHPGSLGRFGPYEVLELLGKGGMGVVFKAFDPALHRVVAVKVLAPQLATSAAARKRFRREAKAAAAVSHDHLVTIHGVEEANGLPYLVMQYVPGASLQQRLDRDGPLPVEEVVRIGIQAAEGLAAAHARGLIHRDVKPANILLEPLSSEPGASAPGGRDPWFRAKITDFSLARAIDDASMTQSGFLAGTPQYMAPEQARGEPVDHRADLFSLGSVLYALCTGRPPFQARTTLAVLRRVSDEAPRPVQEINPNVPDCLVEIMNRLHAKDPTQRYQSAAEVAHLLRGCLARLEHPAPPEECEAPDPRRQRPRRKLLWAAALAVLLLGALAATVLRIRTPEGTLVIEVNDPNVHVTVDGSEVAITGAGPAEVRLRAGDHRLKATREGKTVRDEVVAITRDKKEVVKVRLEPGEVGRRPPPLPGSPSC
jgi:serine/threonine protein kinase